MEWTESEMKRMFDLRELGSTYKEIGFELGAHITTVWKYINSERYKKYLEANKEKLSELRKKYREANKEVINQQRKDKYHMNKEEINNKRREKYAAKKRLSTMIDK